jgi:hypothetical protein
MLVRFDAALNPAIQRVMTTSHETATVFSYLLTPVALIGYVLGIWRLAADLNWVGAFFIQRGILSHWQVWIALAIATQISAASLNRYRRRDQSMVP